VFLFETGRKNVSDVFIRCKPFPYQYPEPAKTA